MKIEWVQKDFNDCIDKVTYTKKIQRSDFLPYGKHPIISQEAKFINGYWNKNDDLYKTDVPVVIFGDHTQVLKYIDFDFVLGADGVKILKARPFLYPKYLYYYLQSIHIKNLGYARHFRLLKEKKVKYPSSLSEQKRIVSKLDDIFKDAEKAKEIAEKNLQNAKDLFESYLENVFSNLREGWETHTLGDIIQKTENCDPTKNPESTFTYIDVSSVNNKTFTIDNTTKLRGRDAPSRARKLVKSGDVIFATVRPTLKRLTIIGKEYDSQICSTGYFILRTKDYISNKLLFYYLMGPNFISEMEKIQKGASYPAVTDGEIRQQVISFPKDLSEQKKLVDILDNLFTDSNRLQEIYSLKLKETASMEKSVLNKAFSGEL